MSKKLLFAIILIFISLFIIAMFYFLKIRQSNSLVNEANFPGALKKSVSGNKIDIQTKSGKVSINNIFSKDKTIYNNNIPEKIKISGNSQFTFEYIYNGDQFIIRLLSKPLLSARQAAEESTISTLGVSKEDACKLGIYMYIPYSVDKKLGANEQIDYGLSWCPGAFVFEE